MRSPLDIVQPFSVDFRESIQEKKKFHKRKKILFLSDKSLRSRQKFENLFGARR